LSATAHERAGMTKTLYDKLKRFNLAIETFR
jgi:hypothetical protein